MASNEVSGKLHRIYDVQQVSEKFKKREFVLELTEMVNGTVYNNYAKMQLSQAKVDLINAFRVGQEVKVNYNLKGMRSEKDGKENFFTNLDVWKIEAVGAQQGGNASQSGGYQQQQQGGYVPQQQQQGYQQAPVQPYPQQGYQQQMPQQQMAGPQGGYQQTMPQQGYQQQPMQQQQGGYQQPPSQQVFYGPPPPSGPVDDLPF